VADQVKLTVPDLGDFSDVEVIEVLVAPGDKVAVEDGLVTLETDKAAMDVPASQAGTVVSVDVNVGDTVSTGDVVVSIEASGDAPVVAPAQGDVSSETRTMAADEIKMAMGKPTANTNHSAQLVVIGSGPGGYTAAFRAADLGLDVILIERYESLGGVCLNVGCIPSKALLHAAKVVDEAEAMAEHGITFGKPKIDALKLRGWKNEVIGKLTGGLVQLAKQRKVRVIHGIARFESPTTLVLDNGETIGFEKCIIAAGSEAVKLPGLPDARDGLRV
jgi:dihydrolipoamide dehydrogenase